MHANGAPFRLPAVVAPLRAFTFVAGFVVTYVVLVVYPVGQQVDAASFADFGLVNGTIGSATGLYRLVVPILLALVALVYGVIALAGHRFFDVGRAVVLVLLSVALCEGLKVLLPRPEVGDFGYAQNTFPSGHVAFAMGTALAIATLVPRNAHRIVVVTVVMLAAVGVAWCSVASFAHRPSDVVGAALIVGATGSLVLWRTPTIYDAMPVLALLLLCCTAAAVVLVIVPPIIPTGARVLFSPGPGSPAAFLGWSALCTISVFFVAGLIPLQGASLALRR
ncbi:phosphatase PAP2 family protein [Rathayibacter sp. CAU 1779]